MQASPQPTGGDVPLRLRGSRWTLIRTAIGGPRELRGKAVRLLRTLRIYASRGELARRLAALRAAGVIDAGPTRLQLLFGGLDMFRFVVVPAARDYCARQGISFRFHQLLRVLDDPVSMIDPTGLLSDRDTIVDHVMQVVHLNPVYDLQLMQMFPGGLADLERQVEAMVQGTHPRARTIGAIVEDPGYHARLLDYVRRFRADPDTPPPVREQPTLRTDPRFRAAERTFATLPGFVGYCRALPTGPGALLRRWRALREFPATA